MVRGILQRNKMSSRTVLLEDDEENNSNNNSNNVESREQPIAEEHATSSFSSVVPADCESSSCCDISKASNDNDNGNDKEEENPDKIESDENGCIVLSEFLNADEEKISSMIMNNELSRKVLRYANKRFTKSQCQQLLVESENNSKPISVKHNEIELGNLLGEGSFSCVFEMERCACRKINKASPSSSFSSPSSLVVKLLRPALLDNPAMLAACAADLSKEGHILASLNHEHILSIHGWSKTGLVGLLTGRHDAIFLILERLDQTLTQRFPIWKRQLQHKKRFLWPFNNINNSKKNSVNNGDAVSIDANFNNKKKGIHHNHEASTMRRVHDQRFQVILQLADALDYLHRQQIMHRDLKPDNIGLQYCHDHHNNGNDDGDDDCRTCRDYSLTAKIFDFDVARRLLRQDDNNISDKNIDTTSKLYTKNVGSPRYMSPECSLGLPYNQATDVYTFALIIHEILTLERPYQDIDSYQHQQQVCHLGERPKVPKSWPTQLQVFLHAAWSSDIQERPSMTVCHQTLKQISQAWFQMEPIKYEKRPTKNKKKSNSKNFFRSTDSFQNARRRYIQQQIAMAHHAQ